MNFYRPSCPSRMLLAQALKAKSLVVRFVAMKQIRTLFRKRLIDFSRWCTILLVQQLCDSHAKIANTALSILIETTEDTDCLHSLINKKPYQFLQGMDNGHTLLIKFLSVTEGFKYVSLINSFIKLNFTCFFT